MAVSVGGLLLRTHSQQRARASRGQRSASSKFDLACEANSHLFYIALRLLLVAIGTEKDRIGKEKRNIVAIPEAEPLLSNTTVKHFAHTPTAQLPTPIYVS